MNIANLYFITAYIRHSGDYLGENPQYVYYNGNLVSFAGVTLLLTLIFGILAILFFGVIAHVLHKKIFKEIVNKYPYDKVIYKFHPASLSAFLLDFFIGGGFVGGYIVPIFMFDEIKHVDMVTKSNVIFYAFIFIGILVTFLLFRSYTLVLTNKRIIGLSYGDFVRDTIIPFDDIKTINKVFGGWEIILKDDNTLPLKYHPKAKKFYGKLKQLLNRGEMNE